MKHRTLIAVVALLIGSVTVVAATGIAGGSEGKPGGCKDIVWELTSTARGFSGTYNEDGVVTKGLKDASYHESNPITFSGPFISSTGQITLDAGNGDTLVIQSHQVARFVSGPVPLGGVGFFDSGTGAFAGATGNLTVSGSFNFDFSTVETKSLVGQLCLP